MDCLLNSVLLILCVMPDTTYYTDGYDGGIYSIQDVLSQLG